MNSTIPASSRRPKSSFLRPLGAVEELFWLLDQHRPIHFVMAAEVEGATRASDWRRALDLVQQRHPLFSVRIEKNKENRPGFRQDLAAPIPLRVVHGIDVTQRWEFETELELSIPFDPANAPLVRVVLLHEEQRAVCLFVIHHSIADGRSVAFVIRDLLQALSGKPVDRLPLIPSAEDTLGITSTDSGYAGTENEAASSPVETPGVFVSKEDTRPRIRTLSLTIDMTSRLRERASQEGTTMHGALSSALALAYWEVVEELRGSPIRVLSPIDIRKLLGLGEDCAVLVGSGKVPIEPCEATTFWEIARSATTRLGRAQTLQAIRAARRRMFQVMRQGLDVSTAADITAQRFAHEIGLTNLGNLGYPTDFGKLELKAVWGPAGAARFVNTHAIGVATTNGSLRLVQTTFTPVESLLETVEEILISSCATRKHVMVAQVPG
jgi:NRPS condensation-like uncharacterized protein